MKYVPQTNDKYALTEKGELISFAKRWKTPRVIKGTRNHHGYVGVYLDMADGTRKNFKLHRLMAEVFYPDEFSPECNVLHRNDIRDDNRLENLYVGTKRDNSRDIVVNGRHNRAKLTLEQAREVRILLRKKPYWEIAEEYGVPETSITNILYGKTYSQLGEFRISDKERDIHYKLEGKYRRTSFAVEKAVRDFAEQNPEATFKQIAEEFDLELSTARRIVLAIGKARNNRTFPIRATSRNNGNEETAKKIVAEWKNGASKTSLSKKYDLHISMVSRITLGQYKYKSEASKRRDKERQAFVMRSMGRKLKDKDCDAIRQAYLDGQTPNQIATRRKLSIVAIRKILSGKARNEASLLPVFNGDLKRDGEKKWYATGSDHAAAKLSEDAVRFIRETRLNGEYSQHELAALFNVSSPVIYYANSGYTWKHVKPEAGSL